MPKRVDDIEIYTVEEVAELLEFRQETIRRMLREGRLTGKKIGNRWFITDADLKKLFLERLDEEGREYNIEDVAERLSE